MLELTLAIGAFALLGALPPTESQKRRDRKGLCGHPLSEQLAVLRQAGVVRRR